MTEVRGKRSYDISSSEQYAKSVDANAVALYSMSDLDKAVKENDFCPCCGRDLTKAPDF